jgi:hypothetical protein
MLVLLIDCLLFYCFLFVVVFPVVLFPYAINVSIVDRFDRSIVYCSSLFCVFVVCCFS